MTLNGGRQMPGSQTNGELRDGWESEERGRRQPHGGARLQQAHGEARPIGRRRQGGQGGGGVALRSGGLQAEAGRESRQGEDQRGKPRGQAGLQAQDRKSTRLNSSH